MLRLELRLHVDPEARQLGGNRFPQRLIAFVADEGVGQRRAEAVHHHRFLLVPDRSRRIERQTHPGDQPVLEIGATPRHARRIDRGRDRFRPRIVAQAAPQPAVQFAALDQRNRGGRIAGEGPRQPPAVPVCVPARSKGRDALRGTCGCRGLSRRPLSHRSRSFSDQRSFGSSASMPRSGSIRFSEMRDVPTSAGYVPRSIFA